ncbi:4-hydroxy-tetrahydrodipicolinate synthase [Oleiharenicola lentus]|jgi:4-hydroxy-tetrahydrodipicolinate synthase|uniref:4-hydroxy-tetrahydrodipicolinate synthase n=1 Tax=Oleiharenicola lentus TaxID=2508720 RepID=A0A4Q1CAI0_9BACT|nr:4-hydroxy-tetrahydrodipicolinate synthase [Oleiharenicola lentus]RXK56085.1 4-hydroxy-tetrahydrodipicolinate synthase [Oleiharenicola lentus]
MNRPRTFTGTYTAIVTPFRDGAVAYDELKKLVNFQIRGGISGLVPVGTTGESPTVSHEEHLDVIRCTIETARGRVPIIAGTGSNSTREAIDMTRAADEAGADGFLLVAPYYNRPTQEGLYRHFAEIAGITNKPIVLYSIPGRCGIEISVKVIERLRAKFPHVAHIKEAGGSVDRVDQIVAALGNDMTVLSGDDSLTLPFMAVGAKGVISVASNLLPKEVSRLVSLALAGDYAKARALHRRLYPVFKTIFIESNPAPIKLAMAEAGIIGSPEVRPPLCELTDASRETLRATLKAFAR